MNNFHMYTIVHRDLTYTQIKKKCSLVICTSHYCWHQHEQEPAWKNFSHSSQVSAKIKLAESSFVLKRDDCDTIRDACKDVISDRIFSASAAMLLSKCIFACLFWTAWNFFLGRRKTFTSHYFCDKILHKVWLSFPVLDRIYYWSIPQRVFFSEWDEQSSIFTFMIYFICHDYCVPDTMLVLQLYWGRFTQLSSMYFRLLTSTNIFMFACILL